MNYKGTITALITPFINQELDEAGLERNIHYQVAQGVNGILLLGSTGESPTLATQEQNRMISLAARLAKGKLPIWVGTGSYCTRQTIEKTKKAQELGADVALIVTPYYNKPTQEGIFRHFEAIANAVKMPIVVYNIPGRCSRNIETSTMLRIAGLPNVIGVKEAAENINQVGEIWYTIRQKHPHFLLYSGDDIMTLPMMALGAIGVISVLSNLIPQPVMALVDAALKGEFDRARELHYQLLPLFKMLFLETNPAPIKTAMQLCGMPAGECRLPLYQMAPENVEYLRQLLMHMQLMHNQ
jgi:4-hydroxy-tetrahydrodipicolinate synthase